MRQQKKNKVSKSLYENYYRWQNKPINNKLVQTTFESYINKKFATHVWAMGLELKEK